MNNVFVYCEIEGTTVVDVSLELLSKGRKLANTLGVQLECICAGKGLDGIEKQVFPYGVDKVHVFDAEGLFPYTTNPHASLVVNLFKEEQPQICLLGATVIGRDLGPRISSAMHSGLTADCTELEIDSFEMSIGGVKKFYENQLCQIRPAFGGNIMAEILTPNHRPQMATVRYKVMDAPKRSSDKSGEIVTFDVPTEELGSHVDVLRVTKKEKEKSIEMADVLVVAGRGLKKKEDIALLQELADELGGEVACTRPMVESGWFDAKHQIGLSGRTVRPKLIITCGVSGAIQFVAGMNNSDTIVAINTDPKASIFKTANYAIVGDLYEVIPKLLSDIREGKGENA